MTDETFLGNRRGARASVGLNRPPLGDAGTAPDIFIPLDIQLMLRARTSKRKMLHDQRGYCGDIIEMETRHIQFDRFIRHHCQETFR